MAELNTSPAAKRDQGIARSKKLSTRVHLTPMVDLGFLLITFFVFTTTITAPTVLNIVTPTNERTDVPTKTGDSKTLTVIPVDHDKIIYYHGALDKAEQQALHGLTSFSTKDGIRDIITQKQQALEAKGIRKAEMFLIIRPSSKASYKNVIDILDEVKINGLEYYSLTDLTDEEKKFLLSKGF